MKKLIYLFMVAGTLWSCQNGNQYSINGTVAGDAYEGTNVYLQQIADNELIAVDTAVVQHGRFSFSGIADTATLRFIALDKSVNPQQESSIPLLLEPGKLKVTFDTVVTVEGTEANEVFSAFWVKQRDLSYQIRDIVEQFNSENASGTMTESRSDELKRAHDEVNQQLTELNFSFIRENIGNKLGEYAFGEFFHLFEPERQKEILNLAGDEFKAGEQIRPLVEKLGNLENVLVGKKFVDFTLKDPQGNEVSLSDYAGKGNYVLIDFWAAWCPPCRREMPDVVAAYEKYKAKGFEVVGVSFDHDYDQWTQGLKEMNMTWPQMSDLMHWESPVLNLYAVDFIPHTILLDQEGTIIEKNLSGEELHTKLAELMP